MSLNIASKTHMPMRRVGRDMSENRDDSIVAEDLLDCVPVSLRISIGSPTHIHRCPKSMFSMRRCPSTVYVEKASIT